MPTFALVTMQEPRPYLMAAPQEGETDAGLQGIRVRPDGTVDLGPGFSVGGAWTPRVNVDQNGVDTDKIGPQLRKVIDALSAAFKALPTVGPFPLKSVEFALTITAEGSVGFLGTGAKAGGEGSITVTFERPSANGM